MSLAIYIPPYSEPVSLVEMKLHCKVESSVSDDDTLIASMTTTARDVIETATGANVSRNRVMLATTFDQTFMQWPHDERLPGYLYIRVQRVPLVSVTSITYVDLSGNTQTLSSSLYSVVDAAAGIISLNYGEIWPNARYQANSITVRFIAGMSCTITGDATTNIFTAYGRTFSTGDRVQIVNSGGALPAGLTALTTYCVIGASGATFQLSATSGGAAIDITTAGTGTNFLALDMLGFETLRSAMKLLVGFWYENRSAVDTGRQAVGATVLPFAVDALVGAQHA